MVAAFTRRDDARRQEGQIGIVGRDDADADDDIDDARSRYIVTPPFFDARDIFSRHGQLHTAYAVRLSRRRPC